MVKNVHMNTCEMPRRPNMDNLVGGNFAIFLILPIEPLMVRPYLLDVPTQGYVKCVLVGCVCFV